MRPNNSSICQKIIEIKTSILVIESQKNISTALNDCLTKKNIDVSVKSKNLKGKCKIKPYDLYIIDCENYTQQEKYLIIKKILENNNQANIFLLHEKNEEESIINQKYNKIVHPIKASVINGIIDCNEVGLQKIIEQIEYVENTKFKIHELWNKLEKF